MNMKCLLLILACLILFGVFITPWPMTNGRTLRVIELDRHSLSVFKVYYTERRAGSATVTTYTWILFRF